MFSVNQQKISRGVQLIDGAAHGQKTGPQDVVNLDFLHRGLPHRPYHPRAGFDGDFHFGAAFRAKLLRVVEPFVMELTGKDNGGGHDRSGQGAPPHLVNPRHADKALGESNLFEVRTGS